MITCSIDKQSREDSLQEPLKLMQLQSVDTKSLSSIQMGALVNDNVCETCMFVF
jgi:hypothetical protein